LVNFNQRPEE